MIELYMAYADYHDLIILVENLLYFLTYKVLGNNLVKYGNYIFDFSKPFDKMTIKESICCYYSEIKTHDLDDILTITDIAQFFGINVEKNWSIGFLQMKIFKQVVESHLIQPTFITEYPVEVSPLARRNDKNPLLTDRFELFIGGFEIGNGFSELNDSEDQKDRFISKIKEKNLDKNVSSFYDKHYVTVLEYGLPPTAGLGIGIDRLIMILTNSNTIRDVIFFPILRPR